MCVLYCYNVTTSVTIVCVFPRSKRDESLTKQSIFVEFITRKSIWILLELVRRWTQHFTKIDQEKRKIEQICIWNPHDYRFTSSVWNFCCWVAGVPPHETRTQRRGARRKGCFRRLRSNSYNWNLSRDVLDSLRQCICPLNIWLPVLVGTFLRRDISSSLSRIVSMDKPQVISKIIFNGTLMIFMPIALGLRIIYLLIKSISRRLRSRANVES